MPARISSRSLIMPNYATRPTAPASGNTAALPNFRITATSPLLSLYRYPDNDNNDVERVPCRPVVIPQERPQFLRRCRGRLAVRIRT